MNPSSNALCGPWNFLFMPTSSILTVIVLFLAFFLLPSYELDDESDDNELSELLLDSDAASSLSLSILCFFHFFSSPFVCNMKVQIFCQLNIGHFFSLRVLPHCPLPLGNPWFCTTLATLSKLPLSRSIILFTNSAACF